VSFDEIEIESETDANKVSFVPFLGISPSRYRDIFAKKRRKKADGTAETWYRGRGPRPMIEVVFPSYHQNEAWALHPLVGSMAGLTLDADEAR